MLLICYGATDDIIVNVDPVMVGGKRQCLHQVLTTSLTLQEEP